MLDDNSVTHVLIPDTDLPKVKILNINNVIYRCERDDKTPVQGPTHKEIEEIVKKALAEVPTDSKVIVNFTETIAECPEKKKQREELLNNLAPIYRPDSTHSIIESLTEIREIEEPAPPEPGSQPNLEKPQDSSKVNHILDDLLRRRMGDAAMRPKGEPRYVLTKVSKFITKKVITEKTCRCI